MSASGGADSSWLSIAAVARAGLKPMCISAAAAPLKAKQVLHDVRKRPRERGLAGQQFIKNDASRIQVGAAVDRLREELLRWHVRRRAHHRPHLRQRR